MLQVNHVTTEAYKGNNKKRIVITTQCVTKIIKFLQIYTFAKRKFLKEMQNEQAALSRCVWRNHHTSNLGLQAYVMHKFKLKVFEMANFQLLAIEDDGEFSRKVCTFKSKDLDEFL